MKRAVRVGGFSVIAVLILASVNGCAMFTKKGIAIDQVPPVVKAAIEKETDGSSSRKIEKGRYGNLTVYTVKYVKNGKKTVVGVAEDGAVMKCCQCCEESWTFEKQRVINIDQVPLAAKAGIEKETSGGDIKEIEEGKCGDIAAYKVEYVKNAARTIVEFTGDGTVMKCWKCSTTEPENQ